MSYSTSSPPTLVVSTIGNQGQALWFLQGADPVATVQVTGYISNGGDLGMKVGDLVTYYDTNLGITSTLNVATVSSTAPGAVDLQDPTTIGSTTNSD
jgi:hypothetical protein